jgi:hypothetical protein
MIPFLMSGSQLAVDDHHIRSGKTLHPFHGDGIAAEITRERAGCFIGPVDYRNRSVDLSGEVAAASSAISRADQQHCLVCELTEHLSCQFHRHIGTEIACADTGFVRTLLAVKKPDASGD